MEVPGKMDVWKPGRWMSGSPGKMDVWKPGKMDVWKPGSPVFVSFALADADDHPLAINVGDLQGSDLHDTRSPAA